MPRRGDKREDGFRYDGVAWRSPASREKSRAYERNHRVWSKGTATAANTGQAAEHLVASDLLARSLQVTKPLNINSAHDLHAKCPRGWVTVQVKTGAKNLSSGNLELHRRRNDIASDIVAIVFLPTRQIRYIPNKTDVPPELQTDLTILHMGGVKSQSSSTSVPVAKRKSNSSLSTTKSRKTVPVAARSKKLSSVRQRPSALGVMAKED